jgi:hypothetical protein
MAALTTGITGPPVHPLVGLSSNFVVYASDSGAGTEAVTHPVAVYGSDAGAGADTAHLLSTVIHAADTGAGTEAVTEPGGPSDADYGAGTDVVNGAGLWFMTNVAYIGNMNSVNAAATLAMFGQPGAFGLSTSASTPGIPAGYNCTPVLKYSSYAQFQSDITASAINSAYGWVMYDTEDYNDTTTEPQDEVDDPWTYMADFVTLAHSNGFKVILAPALDLGNDATSVQLKNAGETDAAWYTRTNIAGTAAATGAEIIHIQAQSLTLLGTFASFFASSLIQVNAARTSPAQQISVGVSVNYGSAAQMWAATQSAAGAAGVWLNITTALDVTGAQYEVMAAPGSPYLVSAADTGTGTDTEHSLTITALASDTGTGTEVVKSPAVKSGADSGAGADSGTQPAERMASDSGTGTDTATSPLVVSGADSGTGTDAAETSSTTVYAADFGTGSSAVGAVVVVGFGPGQYPVSASFSFAWSTLYAHAQTAAAEWNTLLRLSNATGSVLAPFAGTPWYVGNPVYPFTGPCNYGTPTLTSQATWNVSQRVSVLANFGWKTASSAIYQVSKTASFAWNTEANVTTRTNQTATCTWNTRSRASVAVRAAWGTSGRFTTSPRKFRWSVLYKKNQTFSVAWDTRSRTDQSFSSGWHTMYKDPVDFSFGWNTAGRSRKPAVSCTWNTRARTSQAFSAKWDTRKRTDQTFSGTWNILTRPAKTVAFTWNVRVRPVQSYSCMWSVRSRPHLSAACNWNVRTRTDHAFSSTWNARFRKDQTFACAWDILPRQSVLVNCAWNTDERYSVLCLVNWNTMTNGTQSAVSSWDVGAPFQTTILQLPAVAWKALT